MSDNRIYGDNLLSVRTLLDSPLFNRDAPDDSTWIPAFVHLIAHIQDLLLAADQAGHRVDFLDGVGVNGKIQDITSLVNRMDHRLAGLATDQLGSHLN